MGTYKFIDKKNDYLYVINYILIYVQNEIHTLVNYLCRMCQFHHLSYIMS